MHFWSGNFIVMRWQSFTCHWEWPCRDTGVDKGAFDRTARKLASIGGVCVADASHSLSFWSFLVKSLKCCMWVRMPKACCVMGCHSGYKGKDKKVPLLCFPADAERCERCERAIPEQEAVQFYFQPKKCLCVQGASLALDIVRADECIVSRNALKT